MKHGFKYDPEKGTHYGIPARDLTADEVAAMGPMDQRIVRHSPAYRAITEEEAKAESAESAKAEPKRTEAQTARATSQEGSD